MLCHTKLHLPVYNAPILTVHAATLLQLSMLPSQTAMRNMIHDCLHFLLSHAGQTAGLILSRSEICHDTLNLAQCNPTSGPGNLIVTLTPT
jgi:hypothetical protein